MEQEKFIELFADQFDDTPREMFTMSLEFKTLDEWTSLSALSIIAMVDDEYDVTLRGNDIKEAKTIEDLFNTVKAKKA